MTSLTFYIPVTLSPNRIAANISALLALTPIEKDIISNLWATFAVSINIWVLVYIGFVFAGMLEYILALVYSSRKKSSVSIP